MYGCTGGWGGIRTHGGLSPTPVFKTGALNHSATHPIWKKLRLAHSKRLAYLAAYPAQRRRRRQPLHHSLLARRIRVSIPRVTSVLVESRAINMISRSLAPDFATFVTNACRVLWKCKTPSVESGFNSAASRSSRSILAARRYQVPGQSGLFRPPVKRRQAANQTRGQRPFELRSLRSGPYGNRFAGQTPRLNGTPFLPEKVVAP